MSRNIFTCLRDLLSDTARRKGEAAKARREGTPEGIERSSEVYAQSCAKIAERFVEYGFRYAKSGPHLTRTTNGFTHRISFQTSYHNIPGRHVSLSVAANVRSRTLKEWRKDQERSSRTDDWVGGGLIHRLGTDLTYVAWELADARERENTLLDVSSFIESVALPYFECFGQPNELIDQFQKRDFPAMDIADQIEFTLCFGSRAEAQSILDRYVTERSVLASDIDNAEERKRERGFPSCRLTEYADLVAFLRSAYCLRNGAQPGGGANA